MERGAQFDRSGTYRYSLTRCWSGHGATVVFIMLNPSTADARQDDPTIRRCIGFARAWGFSALEVVNLFAYRAAHPARLRAAPRPVGPRNDRHLRAALARADAVVAAWGVHGAWLGRDRAVAGMLDDPGLGLAPQCLGLTKGGHPRHPLYLPLDAGRRPYPLDPG